MSIEWKPQIGLTKNLQSAEVSFELFVYVWQQNDIANPEQFYWMMHADHNNNGVVFKLEPTRIPATTEAVAKEFAISRVRSVLQSLSKNL